MKIVKKIIVYCVGLLIMAFGVSFSIKSNLGVSPVNSIPYVLSIVTEINQGTLIIAVFGVFILIQIILLRKQFKIINITQIIMSTLFGYFVNFTNKLCQFQAPNNYILRLVLLIISIVLIAIGVTLYIAADLIPMPAEGVMLAIVQLTEIPFNKIKVTFDTSVVIIAGVFSLIFFNTLVGVREGTLISALLVGRTMNITNKLIEKQLEFLIK